MHMRRVGKGSAMTHPDRLTIDLADAVERLLDVIANNSRWWNHKLDAQDSIVRDKHVKVAKAVLERANKAIRQRSKESND